MQNLRKYVEEGQVSIAKLNDHKQPIKVEFSELQNQVNNQNKMGKIYQSLQDMTQQEKFEWTNFKRLQANILYKEGKNDEAIQLYLDALIGLDFKGISEETVKQLKEKYLFPILLNMATCFYKKKQFGKALELCEKVLKDSRFVLGLFKKAYILNEIGETDAAKELVVQIFRQPDNKFKADARELLVSINDKKKKQREVYRRIFRGEQDESQNSPLIGNPQKQEILEPRYGTFKTIIDWLTDCSRGIIYGRRKTKQN